MAHSVVVGIQRPDGSRVDTPDPQGNPRPVMLRLGPGLSGAADWPTAGETQVMIQATNQLTISGNGITVPSSINNLVVGSGLTAACTPGSNTATIASTGNTILVDGSGFSGPTAVSQITFSSNLSLAYDTGNNAAVVTAAGGGEALPLGSANTVYCSNGSTNFWDDTPTVNGISTVYATIRPASSGQDHVIRQADDRVIDRTSDGGGTVGSYAMSATPYDGDSAYAPRHAKYNGSFVLVGINVVKVLQFPSAIDGASMPANSTLVGKFMIGWKGMRGGNPYVSGAFEFMFKVTTDASGNLHRFRTALNATEATPSTPYTFSLDSTSLDTSMSVMDGHLPCAISIAIYGTEFWLEFGTYSGPVVQAGDISRFYWECSYGWGTT